MADTTTNTELRLAANATSSASSGTRNIFPFFRLPRELRDKIYGEAHQDVHLPLSTYTGGTDRDWIQCATFHSAVLANLLQVSRRVKLEYEQELARMPARLSLELFEVDALLGLAKRGRKVLLMNHFRRVQSLEIQMDSNGLFATDEYYPDDSKYLVQLLEMLPALRTLGIVCSQYLGALESELRHASSAEDFSRQSVRGRLIDMLGDSVVEPLAIDISIFPHDYLFRCDRRADEGDLRRLVEEQHQNRITYRAVPSNCPFNWYGLELQVDDKETGSYDEAYEEAMRQLEGQETLSIWKVSYRIVRVLREHR